MAMSLLTSGLRLTQPERRFVAGAWLLAPAVTLSLRVVGFRKTVEIVRGWVTLGRPHAGLTVSVERAEQLVARAFQLTLAHDSCLPKSIVQLALHRKHGDRVKLVIGVRRDGHHGDIDIGFEGHAWVEAVDSPSRDGKHAVILELASE